MSERGSRYNQKPKQNSSKKKSQKKDSRTLTVGEISLLSEVFGSQNTDPALGQIRDYKKVRIIRGKALPGQPKNTTVTPDGNMYIPPEAPQYRDDFSAPNVTGYYRAHLIHEMAHVWQYQNQGGVSYIIGSKIVGLTCQRRSKSLPLGRSKSRPVCLIFGYVFWPLQGPEDIVRH